MADIDWGNVPSYFGGLAFLATIGIIGRDRRERTRKQASQVAAWVELDNDKYVVKLRNASDLPVFRLTINLAGPERTPTVSLSKFTEDSANRRLKPIRYDVIGPGTTETTKTYDFGPIRVTGLEFRDAAGIRWRRHTHGALIRLVGQEARQP